MTEPLFTAFLTVFDTLIGLYIWVVIVAVAVSWLIAFGVINTRSNDLARQFVNILDRLTDPVFRRIRKIVPPIAGLDLSPLILILALEVIKILVDGYVYKLYAWSVGA
jgi:YggT family protein